MVFQAALCSQVFVWCSAVSHSLAFFYWRRIIHILKMLPDIRVYLESMPLRNKLKSGIHFYAWHILKVILLRCFLKLSTVLLVYSFQWVSGITPIVVLYISVFLQLHSCLCCLIFSIFSFCNMPVRLKLFWKLLTRPSKNIYNL